MPHYAKCDVTKKTEISHQQNVAAQKYKRTCITVLNTLPHHAITVSWIHSCQINTITCR